MWLLKYLGYIPDKPNKEKITPKVEKEPTCEDKISLYRKTHKDCRTCKFYKDSSWNSTCKVKNASIEFPYFHKFCKIYQPKEFSNNA